MPYLKRSSLVDTSTKNWRKKLYVGPVAGQGTLKLQAQYFLHNTFCSFRYVQIFTVRGHYLISKNVGKSIFELYEIFKTWL